MKTIQERARERQRQIETQRKDPRYLQVVGRLVAENLLVGNHVVPTRAHPTLEDALWAAEVEPRILELLPAILVRRPKLFLNAKPLPEDLVQIIRELRRGAPVTTFRGVPPKKYQYWMGRIGRKGKALSVSKTHRFTEEDRENLDELKRRWSVDETEVIRRAINLAVHGHERA